LISGAQGNGRDAGGWFRRRSLKKGFKILVNSVYAVGAICVLILVVILFWGEALIPFDYETQMVPVNFSAWLLLMFGTIPMVIACVAVYFVNNLKNGGHKIISFILVFLPGLICLIAGASLLVLWLLPVLGITEFYQFM